MIMIDCWCPPRVKCGFHSEILSVEPKTLKVNAHLSKTETHNGESNLYLIRKGYFFAQIFKREKKIANCAAFVSTFPMFRQVLPCFNFIIK